MQCWYVAVDMVSGGSNLSCMCGGVQVVSQLFFWSGGLSYVRNTK
jgi:hypothetical protein